jgi:putative serine protease PepD
MTDSRDMPDAPWWSQPGATAVLPQEQPAPAYQELRAEPKPRRAPNKTAVLLALALLAGGGAGGVVASALHDDPKLVNGSVISQTRVVGDTDKTISGTPESAAAVIGPSVVTVEVTGRSTNPFGGASSSTDTGSGIIIRTTGYILTNNHVVSAATGGNGTVHVTLQDGKTVPATIVGTDPSIDLAVLRISGVSDLHAATFADSSRLRVGQAVLAVGAPLGLANTVTQGIVSTLQRPVRTGDSSSQQAVIDAVQTDAAINPGNSGGALVDLAGRVVGINSAIATTGGSAGGQSGNIGVGFAIPSNTAVKVADQLIATGKATHSQMGVSVGDAPNSTDGAPGLGATISAVTPGGPAQKAGLRAGDVVTKVDDRRVTDADSLIVAIRSHDPGSTVTLTVTRGGQQVTVKVTLAGVSS